jgi:site-specific recombinase XerD
MASVTPYPAGYSLKWHYPPNTQRHARLSGFTSAQAEEAAEHVEALIRAARSRRPVGYATTRWLQSEAPANLVAALVDSYLVDDRRTIADAVEAFLTDVTRDVSVGRLGDLERELNKFVKFIGDRVNVSDVTRADVDRWADSIAELSPSTQSKYAAIIRQFFKWTAAERLVDTSPAKHLDHRTFAAEARREVTADEFLALLAVVDSVSRLALMLTRYAGLRVTEACRLRWDRVDLAGRALNVDDTKRGRDRRVPLVDPLFDFIAAEFRQWLEDGGPAVFVMVDNNALNVGEPVTRSVIDGRIRSAAHAAGVPLWPRLFHNLRATRQTEWIAAHGLVNACHWIGNSQTVAARHYAMATEVAFLEATKPPPYSSCVTSTWKDGRFVDEITPIHWDADKQTATTDPNAGPAIGRVLPTETGAGHE